MRAESTRRMWGHMRFATDVRASGFILRVVEII